MTGEFVARVRADVERRLGELIEPPQGLRTSGRIQEAVHYALLGGGKRFRPLLVIASGEGCLQGRPSPEVAGRLLTAACALEMIHTFSLVHDDLPALDNDALRRGRATLHVKFDEATAILAGDAILNLAYQTLALGHEDPEAGLMAISIVAGAVGLRGMIAGQALDLEAEGVQVDAETLHRIHALKTGALITACCEIGGVLAGGSPAQIGSLVQYGRHLGLAFQITDDILDVEGSAGELGKSPGKDAGAGKATFPAMLGIEESRRRAARCVEDACAAVAGLESSRLVELARSVLTRKN